MKKLWCVGLTGGIASGKSTVSALFKKRGVVVIDTDLVNAELIGPGGAAIPELEAQFGQAVITKDGALDRALMRARAFKEPEVRRQLEALLHPLIRKEVEQRLASAQGPYAMLVIPLLFETGFFKDRLNRTLVVDAEEGAQRARALLRPGVTEEQIDAILSVQCARDQRLAWADDRIENHGDLGDLEAQVECLHRQYLTLSAA